MATVDEAYARFWRTVVEPYWCRGSPLEWQVDSIGIAHFAYKGDVGSFNLAWWLIGRDDPPKDAKSYQDAPLHWVIMHAPTVKYKGLYLTQWAASTTLFEWQHLVQHMPERSDLVHIRYAAAQRQS